VGQFESGTGIPACAAYRDVENSCDVYQRRGGGIFIFFKLTDCPICSSVVLV
jgi:hypothetical protein